MSEEGTCCSGLRYTNRLLFTDVSIFKRDADKSDIWQHDALFKQIFNLVILMFVSGCGKHSILGFEPVNNDEKRTMSSVVMIVSPIIFKFSFLDFFLRSSFIQTFFVS